MNNTGLSCRLRLLSQLCLDYNQIVADVKNADRKRRVYRNKELGLSLFSSDELLNRDNSSRIEQQLRANIGEESVSRYREFDKFMCLEFLGDLFRRTSKDDSTPRLNAGFVAYDKTSKQVVVVLLGSLKPSDYWLYNGDLCRASALKTWGDRLSVLPSGLESLELHRGYASLALELSIQVDAIVADTFGIHENKITSYLYTGHSLGAAAAGHMQILKEFEILQDAARLTTYGLLFAQPRSIVVVDAQGNKNDVLETPFMRSLATRTIDFVVAKDIVPIVSEMCPANLIGQERNHTECDHEEDGDSFMRGIGMKIARFRRQYGQSAFGALGTRWEAGTADGLFAIPSGLRHFAKVYVKEVTKAIDFEFLDTDDDDPNEEKAWTDLKTAKHIDGTETLKWLARSRFALDAECDSDSDGTATPHSSDVIESMNDVITPCESLRASHEASDGNFLPSLALHDWEDSCNDVGEEWVVASPIRCMQLRSMSTE
jgi:hypothetical protein